MEFKPAQCPSCGGALQLPNDKVTVNCMYCGVAIVVREAISAAAAASIPNLLTLANASAQSKNYSEAYDYYNRTLELDSRNSEAWAGKATAAGWLTDQQSFRIPEMINYFANSIEFASVDSQTKLRAAAADTISRVTTQYYNRMRADLSPTLFAGPSWTLYLNSLGALFKAIDSAHKLLPDSVAVLQTGLYICGDNEGSVQYVNRITGRIACRYLTQEWSSFVNERKRIFKKALWRLAPSVKPVAVTKSPNVVVQPMTLLTKTVIAGVALLFLMMMLLGASK